MSHHYDLPQKVNEKQTVDRLFRLEQAQSCELMSLF